MLSLCSNMNGRLIILFDGVCNFCNSAVNFVLKRNTKMLISFAAMQSTAGEKLLEEYHFQKNIFSSFIFIDNNKVFTRSTAALRVCKYLDGLWPLCYGFIIVPKFIRDGLYNLIAKNRYKWFGKKDSCIIPAAELRARFLN